MRRVGLVMIASFVAASTLAAQDKGIDKGTVEIGAFGRVVKYPTNAYQIHGNFGDHAGVGGRIGFFVARNVALEVDGSYNETDLVANQPLIPATANNYPVARLQYLPFHLDIVYNAPLSEHAFWMFGAGASYNKLAASIKRNDVGFGGMTGLRLRVSRLLSIRLDGTADVIPSGFASKSNVYLAGQAGLSLMFGGAGCNHSTDMISIRPTSANLQPGQTQTFTAPATYCGASDQVVYRMSGVGQLDSMSGLYTATTVGTATVTAYSRKGKMTSAANITVAAPVAAPPPPPPAPPPPPPPPPPAAPPRYTFDMQMVHFRFDHADLTKGGQDSVRAIAETLKSHPEVAVDVIGHCDWIGTEAYNMKLSRARAETVRRLLIASGVAADRITVKWRGKDEPIADNKTASGRAMNRRAEVKQNN